MAGDQDANDAVSERPVQSEGERRPLVTNSDMQDFQNSQNATKAQYTPDSGQQSPNTPATNGELDFRSHYIPGYDNCVDAHYQDDHRNGRESDNGAAGTRALNAPNEAPPANLSDAQKEAVRDFMEGAKGYEKEQEEFLKSGNVGTFLENGDRNNEKMRESLDKLPEKEQAGALAAINKELEKDNRKVARAPETKDLYLGYINPNNPGGPISRGHRISKGPCPMS